MDVYNMYLGDLGSSYSPRNNLYRDYEKFPYGSLERVSNPQKSYYTIVQEKLQRARSGKQKESCPFCQEQKKRPLIAYMRKRAQEKHGKICEEEAEAEAEEAQAVAAAAANAAGGCKNGHGVQHGNGCGKENNGGVGGGGGRK